MPVAIVEMLEEVDVQNEQQALTVAPGGVQIFVDVLLRRLTVAQTGQGIAAALGRTVPCFCFPSASGV